MDNAELQRIRADIVDITLPDTCTILSKTDTADGMGGMTSAWGTAAVNVKCRMDARGGRETLAGAAIQPYQQFVLTVPQATVITTANRVLYASEQYNILNVSAGSWIACKRAIVERV
jgi:head-tail adaptor